MAIRITKEQVEAAAAAREQALSQDPDFRKFEEQQQEEMQAADERTDQEEEG
jgi:hypothetical protein